MNERVLSDYLDLQEKGLKPIMMAGHQVDALLGMICDKIISDLEKGLVACWCWTVGWRRWKMCYPCGGNGD